MHPIVPCNANNNHIAYYVLDLQHESYLRVMGLNPDVKAFIFDFDVRKDSAKMKTSKHQFKAAILIAELKCAVFNLEPIPWC
jgi:hypothetical protein